MRRFRLTLLLCNLLLALLLVPAVWLIFGHSYRVTRANIEKIQEGMTADEVLAILGRENLQKCHHLPGLFLNECYSEDDGSWLFPGDAVWIEFDPHNQRVLSKELRSPTLEKTWERFRRRVRDRVGW